MRTEGYARRSESLGQRVVFHLRSFPALLFVASLFVWSLGCGDDPVDLCADVDCARGSCVPSRGTCDNPSRCVEDEACLEGYGCNEAGQCLAAFPCATQDDCERGSCVQGACVSNERCDIDDECVAGDYCTRNGTCSPDACFGQSCERGICQRATGVCVSDGTCTPDTEESSCIFGEYCYDFVCVTESALCEELGCEQGRGVCNPAQKGCENAENCDGSDNNCLQGYFCDETQCRINLCLQGSEECSRGVCEPGTGNCINADSCANPGRCLDGHYCVEGGCEDAITACERCGGNQDCAYDPGNLAIICEENALGCVDGRDCIGDRVCAGGRCQAPAECVPDGLEPNDVSAEATNLNAVMASLGGPVVATLCAMDVDVYRFDTRGLGLIRGQLVAEVRYFREDIGIGALEILVRNADGDVLARQDSGNVGFASLSLPILAHQLGEFEIEISAKSDVGLQGVRYTLAAEFLPTTIVAACEAAIELEPGAVESDSRRGNSSQMGSSCTMRENFAGEDIYRFTVNRASFIEVELIPEPGANVDLTMSLRQNCLSLFSEIACVDDREDNGTEYLGVVVDPGEYFLIIQGPTAGTGGPYTMNFSAEPVVCASGQGRCISGESAEVCNARGTGFDVVDCAQGCAEERGNCDRLDGDACHVAFDASGGYEGSIFWPAFTNDYDPASSSCVPNNEGSTATAGGDVAYFVELPPGHALEANLTMGQPSGSLYLVRDCSRIDATCIAGVNGRTVNDEGLYDNQLIHYNGTNLTQRLYLIADNGPGFNFEPADISITTGARSCEPAQARCNQGSREVCNASGTAYITERGCPFGCDESVGECLPPQNDTCKGAVDIIDWGGTFQDRIEVYANDYNPGTSGCALHSLGGPDALFTVELEEGQVLDARLQSEFDGALWLMTNCLEAAESCLASADRFTAQPENLIFVAPEAGRYYLVVDTRELRAEGEFTLTARVLTPTCEAGENLGCADTNTLSFCNELGLPVDYTCSAGCSGGACGTPRGDSCVDALPLTPGQAVTGRFTGTNTINAGTGSVAGCFFEESGLGPETVYAVALTEGQRLNVQVESETLFTIVYLMNSCSVTRSCLSNTPTDRSHRLVYDAPRDETVYVVVDRTLPSTSTSAYSLTASVQSPGCSLGSVQCIDASTLGVCEDNGFYEPYLCSGTCSQGQCTQPRGDICQDAVPLESGMEVSGSWIGTNQSEVGPGLVGACDFGDDRAVGSDTIYSVALKAGEVLEATITSGAGSSLLYLLQSCDRGETCVAGPIRGSSTLFYLAEQDEEVFLIVDRDDPSPLTQTYTLNLHIEQSYCEFGDIVCSIDGSSLETCNVYGVSESYTCANGCVDGRCADPTGQVCEEAIILVSGDVVSGDFTGTNGISLSSGAQGECTIPSAGTVGNDRIYEIALIAGERLSAVLDTVNSQALLYLMGACGDGSSCLAATSSSSDLTLSYTAPEDEVVYLVVDRTSSFSTSDTFELGVLVQPPGCLDGARTCYGGRILANCVDDDDYELYLCDGPCTGASCELPRGDVCYDAIVLQSGEEVTGSWRGTDAVNPGSGQVGACNFGTAQALGRDTIYAVDLQPGEVMQVDLSTTMSTALVYLLSDCTDPAQSCLANASGTGSSLFYLASDFERVYIVVDRTSSFSSTATYSLTATVQAQSCTPGTRQCGEGSTLEYCNDFAIWQAYECSNGCADDACVNPQGDSCFEALPVTTPALLTGGWTGTNAINPGTGSVGSCEFGTTSGIGRDTVYALAMEAGQVLRAELLTSDGSAMLYVLDDCTRPDSCLVNARQLGSSILYYESDAFKTVFVVVDYRYTWTSSLTYSLDLTVQDPGCEPGFARCAADGETLEICNELGVFDYYGCDGTCSEGRCDTPTGDICADPIVLVSGDSVTGSWQGTNSIELGSGEVGACAFGTRAGAGRDTIYAIDLQPGDVLDAKLTTGNTNAMLYLVDQCHHSGTCLDYARPASAPRLSYVYEGEEPGRVYLVVDSNSTFSTTVTYGLDVHVGPPLCSPGERLCSDDLKSVRLCMSAGVYEDSPCSDECLEGVCLTPGGDSCADAIPLRAGDEFVGSLSSYTNRVNVGPATCLYGKTIDELVGRDAVFAIDLNEGDLLDLEVIPSSGFLSLYVLESCFESAEDACPFGVVNSRHLSFYAAESKTYYLVVDSLTSWATPSFTLRVEVEPFIGQCQPGGTSCDEDTATLSICNAGGTEIAAVATCAHGCDRDQCAPPLQANSTCPDVETIWGSTRIRDHLSRFENTFNPGTESCVGVATPGRDAVYRVSLGGGQVLRATASASSNLNDVALYLARDCTDPGDTCLDAARLRQGSSTVGYVATEAEDVYLFVDTEFAGSSGYFSIDIQIDVPDCLPESSSYCSGTVFMECDRFGQYQEVPCPFGCDVQGCLPPPNDSCEDALDATQGLGFTGEISAYTPLYAAPLGCGAGSGAGPEAIFYVDVEPFEVIRVAYRGIGYNTSLWITRDCEAEGDAAREACVAGTSVGSGQQELLEFIAREGGRYYIIADASATSARGGFEVDIWIDPPFCAADEVSCINANTLGLCAPERNEFISYACDGGCSNGQCGTPRGDICQDVIVTGGAGVFQGDFSTLTPRINLPFGGCTGFDSPGPEAIYAVELQQGQTLTATLSNINAEVDLSLYLVGDCLNAGQTCAVGSDVYGAAAETITYVAESNETVFIVADSYTENATGRFELEIAIQ